jgi:2-iminobutanoate/2-iminopropanoate deaminase
MTGGRAVFTAGQDDCRAQLQQVFENLKAAVEAARGTFPDVIKLSSYFLDIFHLAEFRVVRDKYVNLRNPLASTAVQETRLFRPEFLAEAVAAVPNK